MYTDRFKPRRSVEKRYAAAINRIMEGLRRRLTGATVLFKCSRCCEASRGRQTRLPG